MEEKCDRVCDQMMRLIDNIKVAFIALAEDQGLTKVQLFALEALSRHDELAMGKAAAVLHCDASNVTGIVDRLVNQGLVEQKVCPTDRRAKTLRLTPKGHELVLALRGTLARRFGCDQFTDEEERLLNKIVDRIAV